MDVATEAKRSLYATVGAGEWTAKTVREGVGWLWEISRDPRPWLDRLGSTYEDLAERGEHVLRRAETQAGQYGSAAVRTARQVPGVAQAEGELTGTLADADDLPVRDYDTLSAEQVITRLPQLPQRELHQIDGYERRHRSREQVLRKIDTLRGREPWPGYDEMTVDEVVARLSGASPDELDAVARYEERHKNRRTVRNAATRS